MQQLALEIANHDALIEVLNDGLELSFTGTERLLRPLPFGDVFRRAFIADNCAFLVSDGANVFRKPDLGPIFPIRFQLIVEHEAILLEQTFELLTASWIDVIVARDIGSLVD